MINLSTWIYPFGNNDKESKDILSKLIIQDNALSPDKDTKLAFEDYYKRYLPKQLNGFMYGVSGTQAVEYAMLIASKITGKRKFIYYKGSYHGNSLSILPTVFCNENENNVYTFKEVIPPYCFRCSNKCKGEYQCLKQIFEAVDSDVDSIAGMIIDPAFGNIVCNPGKEYFGMLQRECKQRNIQLIFDEIRVGYGRTGRNFAYELLDIVPDILCVSKAIACGLPLSLTIYDSGKISYADIVNNNFHIESTFAGQRISLEMAKYTIRRIDNLIALNQFENINYFRDRLDTLLKYDCVGDLRNFGLIYAIEFINPKSGEHSVARAQKFVNIIRQHGINTNGIRYKSIVLVHPFINITNHEIDKVIDIFNAALN